MKTLSIVIIVLAVCLCPFAVVQGDQNQNEAFYKKCIDEKIAKCESKRRLVHSQGDHLKTYGKKKGDEARFYEKNKKKLINAMVKQEVPKNPTAVHHFLIKAFH